MWDLIREILKDFIGRPMEEPEPTFGGPLPPELQNDLVNYFLFAVGVVATGIGVATCNWMLSCVGGVALGLFTRRIK